MSRKSRLAVLAAARTPQAKAFGVLAGVSAVELGRHAATQVLQRAGFEARDIEEVVFGNVAGPPDATNLARVIGLAAGVPEHRIAHTVNRNCASGMEAIITAWQAINERRAGLVLAGGAESMSNIPMLLSASLKDKLLQASRAKSVWQRLKVLSHLRPKDFKPIPGVQLGLTDPSCGLNMGETAELLAEEFSISREEQDTWAVDSHRKACAAAERCFLSGEIAPLAVGDHWVKKDVGPREGQSMEQLAKLKPIFNPSGTVTAGNSCPLTDGAAALLLASAAEVPKFDVLPLGYIADYAIAGCDPRRMGLGPVFAIAKLLERTGLTLNDFDLIELNEAFAAQTIACLRALESKKFARRYLGRSQPVGQIDLEKLNVHGGAIALGHPVGTTGARIVMTLLRALKERGLQRGLATLCVGGGQGVAMLVETS